VGENVRQIHREYGQSKRKYCEGLTRESLSGGVVNTFKRKEKIKVVKERVMIKDSKTFDE